MSSTRRLCLGLTYLLVVVGVAAFAVAMNRGVFESVTRIEVVGDRAGLTLAPGARVKFRGVDVGKVASIDPAASGARIHVDLYDDQVRFVPAGVTAQIIPPTAFGAKYVNLVAGAAAVGHPPISAGAQVRAEHVTTEFNDAFENVTKVMQVARPDRVNNALTASARILDGRGAELGELVTGLDRYLGEFNTTLPDLSRDLQATGPVLGVYDRSADDLVTLLDNVGVASRTLTRRQSSLGDLLSSTSEFSTVTGRFLDVNQPGIARVVNLYDPVTAALARYSPELPCTLSGAVVLNGQVENIFGGRKPGYYTYTKFRPNDPPYRPGANLPVVREDSGPHCFGLPVVDRTEAARQLPLFDTGANPDRAPKPAADELARTFFGALAGLVSGP
jgi:phospholipid/cholesterol/gamma-HCH transport system substrate-binding protein